MKSKYLITTDGSRLNISSDSITYRVLKYIWEAGESGIRYTDIVKYIVEDIKGRKYDSSWRGYWGTNLLTRKSRWNSDKIGILPRFANKNVYKKWVLTDIVLKSHFEGITDGMVEDSITGDRCWFKDGVPHREDGPAIELGNGTKRWIVNGKRHREDGPAVEHGKWGMKFYFLNDKKLTEEEFDKFLIKKSGADEMDIELMDTLGLFDETLDEDMVAPMDPGPGSPGGFFQSPESMPTSMDTYSLVGPMKPNKKVKSKKKNKKSNKILSFKDFIGSIRK